MKRILVNRPEKIMVLPEVANIKGAKSFVAYGQPKYKKLWTASPNEQLIVCVFLSFCVLPLKPL